MKFILLCLALTLPCAAQSIESRIYLAAHPPATSRPPAKLFIGNTAFEVGMLEPEYMGGNDGVTICAKQLILVNVNTSEVVMRKAFMHEALHAIFCVYAPKTHWWQRAETKRHKEIYMLGPALSALIADNPYLDRWLQYYPDPTKP